MQARPNSERVQYLDGIRGVAILLVVFYHYVPCAIPEGSGKWLTRLRDCTELSITGVDLFFVLSGFLIASILRKNRGAENYFRTFYIRRFARIVPLYLLVLAAFAVLPRGNGWLFDGHVPLWSYATFTQNIYMGATGSTGPHFLGITWSLAVEEQFYLLMPLLIYALNWRRAVVACFAGAALAIGLRHAFPGFHGYVNMPFRMDALMYGALIALFSERFQIGRYRAVFAVPAVAGLVCAALMAAGVLRVSSETRHTMIAVTYAAGLLCAMTFRPLQAVLSNRLLVWFGVMAYGIYIIHEAVSGYVHGGKPVLGWPTLAAFGVTMGVAAALFRWLEKPFMDWGHQFRYRRSEVVALPVVDTHSKYAR